MWSSVNYSVLSHAMWRSDPLQLPEQRCLFQLFPIRGILSSLKWNPPYLIWNLTLQHLPSTFWCRPLRITCHSWTSWEKRLLWARYATAGCSTVSTENNLSFASLVKDYQLVIWCFNNPGSPSQVKVKMYNSWVDVCLWLWKGQSLMTILPRNHTDSEVITFHQNISILPALCRKRIRNSYQ